YLLPEGQADYGQSGDYQLDTENGSVAASPVHAVRQGKRHKIRAGRNADAVETVEKTHLHRVIVKRYIIVQGRVNRSRADSQRNSAQAKPEKIPGAGKAGQCDGGKAGGES